MNPVSGINLLSYHVSGILHHGSVRLFPLFTSAPLHLFIQFRVPKDICSYVGAASSREGAYVGAASSREKVIVVAEFTLQAPAL